MADLALRGLAPETVRLVRQVRAWSVEQVRPLARLADQMHDIPDAARAALGTCPVQGPPVGGGLDYPGRGTADFDETATDGPNVLGVSLMEALSYGDVLAHTLTSEGESLADHVVKAVGSPDQVRNFSGAIAGGVYNLMAFAMTEPDCGSDPARISTTVRRHRDGWVLNGRKVFCSNGAVADLLLVFATIDLGLGHRGIRAVVVERRTPGVHIVKGNERKLGWRSMMTTELAFENAVVPYDALLGGETDNTSGLRDGLGALNFTRGYMGAMVVGIAQAAVDEGRRVLGLERDSWNPRRRVQLDEELSRMDWALHRARLLSRRFASLADNGLPYARSGSIAKAWAPPVAEQVVLRVLQLLGSAGYSETGLLEKWHRDVKIFDIFEGTGNIQRLTIGRHLRALTPA